MESNTDVRITSIVSQQTFLEMDELEKKLERSVLLSRELINNMNELSKFFPKIKEDQIIHDKNFVSNHV